MISDGQWGRRSSQVTGEPRPKKSVPKSYSAPTLVKWGKLVEITQGPFGALTDAPFNGSRNAE